MKNSDVKKIIDESLSPDVETDLFMEKLEKAGVTYSFRSDFTEKVLDHVARGTLVVRREIDFMRSLNRAFYRIALTGVAAIVILLISIYIMQGSLSFNSFIGLSDSYNESIVCLLTGN